MIPSRWDRPGQSAQGSVSPTQARFAANAARIRGQPRSTSVLPFHGYRAWCTMVHQTRNLSDATPIARGNTPLTIPILIIEAAGSAVHRGDGGALAESTPNCGLPTSLSHLRGLSPRFINTSCATSEVRVEVPSTDPPARAGLKMCSLTTGSKVCSV
jgi:hypothetical protein